MKISPNVVEQNRNVNYSLTLKDTSNIESIEVLSRSDYYHKDMPSYTIEKSTIYFSYKMPHIGEFVVKVNFTYKESKLASLYCLDKNMIKLRPLKGDLHMHSVYSDGRATPFAMVMASLDAGMDFLSVTDHDNYDGSLNAIKKVKENNIDILALRGEEVSVGGKKDMSIAQGNGHILSIGANVSIEDQRKDTLKYEKELQVIADNLKKENIDKNIDPNHYAKNIWVINKIKEAKGISILAHPNWIYRDGKYHLHQAFYKEMLKSSHLDGVEAFGEEKVKEHNNMTHLTALQTKNKHKYIAPFANSDAHDSDHEIGDRFTVVFVEEKTDSSLIKAMQDGLCCAVCKRENYEHQFIGKDDIAKYVYFLIKEYYPKHTALKSRLAKLYIDQLINGESFEKKINRTRKRLEEYTNSFYGIENL
ncbi:PHP domain-containing protein [Sulfurimonas sp. SAG-AH-194-L11]|nr:PHP domain-containing protein [Sulfurimonas sp. SAG-AH-194-L11]MDF1878005.1 PHP domain-containing protein [Sulfurimonas sp. SAG-AH-194-L11]